MRGLGLDQACSQVLRAPTGHHNDYRTAGLQSRSRARGIPFPRIVQRQLGLGVLFRVRIVNDQEVRATTRHRTAYTNSKVFPAVVRVPPSGSLAVRFELHRVK